METLGTGASRPKTCFFFFWNLDYASCLCTYIYDVGWKGSGLFMPDLVIARGSSMTPIIIISVSANILKLLQIIPGAYLSDPDR